MARTKRDGTIERSCAECGHKWPTTPGTVQENVHCPACGAEHADLKAEKEAFDAASSDAESTEAPEV